MDIGKSKSLQCFNNLILVIFIVCAVSCVWNVFGLYSAFLFTGLVSGDSIEPDKEKNVLTKETETAKLSCSYSTTSNDIRLYWYRQYPNGELMFLAYKGARSWSTAETTESCSVSGDYITNIHWTHYYRWTSVRFSSLLLCSKSCSPVIQNMRHRTKTWNYFHFENI